MPASDELPRCPWCLGSPAYIAYHDEEWGRPCHDERKLFEFLILEGAQAGLSWSTILAKRENYRAALDGFDPERIAQYGDERIEALMQNAGIVRNRLKLQSTRSNARAFLELQARDGSFDRWLWNHVDGAPIVNRHAGIQQVPARTELSDRISKSLLKLGFRFVGSTIVYAYLQAMGVVNDHLLACHRHPQHSTD